MQPQRCAPLSWYRTRDAQPFGSNIQKASQNGGSRAASWKSAPQVDPEENLSCPRTELPSVLSISAVCQCFFWTSWSGKAPVLDSLFFSAGSQPLHSCPWGMDLFGDLSRVCHCYCHLPVFEVEQCCDATIHWRRPKRFGNRAYPTTKLHVSFSAFCETSVVDHHFESCNLNPRGFFVFSIFESFF